MASINGVNSLNFQLVFFFFAKDLVQGKSQMMNNNPKLK